MGATFSRGLRACLLAAASLVATPGFTHERIGANLNGIADFARNHEFVNVLRQARGIGQFGTPYLGQAPLALWGQTRV